MERLDMVLELRREFVRFRVRRDRPAYIGSRFRSYLTGKVLDVGCDQAVLRELIGADRYVGVGMTPEADVKINLEAAEGLPYNDASWDTVVCLDTLEHLNNLHDFARELFRVSSRHVIISLPNCWCNARRSLSRGRGAIWQYGLPLEKPADRHKWFFSTEEACGFLREQARRNDFPVEIVELVGLENRRPLINRIWRRVKYPSRRRY